MFLPQNDFIVQCIMKARLIDIAKQANVSTSTVSLVLRGKPGASDETIERVQRIARESGYSFQEPSQRCTDKQLTFAKIIKHGDILNPDHFLFVNDYIDGIIAQAKNHGYGVIVDTFDLRQLSMHQILNKLSLHSSSGIIILATELNPIDIQKFKTLNVPFVFLDAYYDYLPFPFFDMNNTDSLYQIIGYLKSNGHSKIGMCSSKCESANYQRRITDFETCLKQFDLELFPSEEFCIQHGKTTEYHEIREALRKRRNNLPTALFCISDALALNVLKACNELGIAIPSELSLIGFDNLEVNDYIVPRLTSVDVPKRAIGEEAAINLISMIETTGPDYSKKVLLSGNIIYRDSVANIKKQKRVI